MATSCSADFDKAWAQVIAKSWSDQDYRKKVERDPAAVLAEMGVALPDGVMVTVTGTGAVENNTAFVLPFPPRPADLGDGFVSEDRVVASGCSSSSICSSCP